MQQAVRSETHRHGDDSSRCGPRAWHHRGVTDQLDVLLLLALPASGKSEVRRYLDHLDPESARRDMALGPTAQLDDYPYVHLMRRISHELAALGADPVFFASDETPWQEPLDWLTLIHLINDDFARMGAGGGEPPTPSGLLDRFDGARILAGAPEPFRALSPRVRAALEASIAADVAEMVALELGTELTVERKESQADKLATQFEAM